MLPLLEGERVSLVTAYLGLVDTANGTNVRLDPHQVADFPWVASRSP